MEVSGVKIIGFAELLKPISDLDPPLYSGCINTNTIFKSQEIFSQVRGDPLSSFFSGLFRRDKQYNLCCNTIDVCINNGTINDFTFAPSPLSSPPKWGRGEGEGAKQATRCSITFTKLNN